MSNSVLRRAACVAVVVLCTVPAAAAAAPVTVNLRVEGPTGTAFEGPVTTDVRPVAFTDAPGTSYPCDGTAAGGYGGTSPDPVPTRGAALMAAAEQAGLVLKGAFSSYGMSLSQVGDQNVDYDAATGRYLAEYKNGQYASLGACGDPVAAGDDVLFAFADGSETLLGLTGPATAALDEKVTVTVTDLGSPGKPVAGANVGGATTGADGTAMVGPFATPGEHDLKATKTGAIRSNRLRICVTDGADGYCGTKVPPPVIAPPPCQSNGQDGLCGNPDREPALSRITGVGEQQSFVRGRGPRTLSGTVSATGAQVKMVEARLTRRAGGRCEAWSGARERFVRARCGAGNGPWFAVGTTADWSYLLPAPLGPGRYVLDTRATDGAGNVDAALARGRNRVVFFVR